MKEPMRARTRALRFAAVLAGVAVLAAGARVADAEAWGGRYTTSTGESVNVTMSDRYPVDESATRAWAEFLTTLVHGPEISRVRLHLAPYSEVQSVCGFDALACYLFQQELIVAPREDFQAGPTARAVVTHEYGHHLARNRVNAPWDSLRYGTKRWGSQIGVCARTENGTLFPGGRGFRYRLDPGEGFAESYRVLNEQRAGLPESPWEVVDTSLRPDQAALAALEQDILAPWTGPTVQARVGTFRRARGTATRSFALATPLDGSLRITLAAPTNARFRLSVYDVSRKATLVTARPGARTLSTLICGQRSLSVRVTRVAGKGRFSLSISKP
jgi:hypothetical protein